MNKKIKKFFLLITISTVRASVIFGRHQFFGTSEHYRKAHGSLLSGWMNYNYSACCQFPTSSNISKHPSQFWQIRFESYWFPCSKCRLLVLLRYLEFVPSWSDLHITRQENWKIIWIEVSNNVCMCILQSVLFPVPFNQKDCHMLTGTFILNRFFRNLSGNLWTVTNTVQTFMNYSYCIDHLLKEINVTLNLNLNLN